MRLTALPTYNTVPSAAIMRYTPALLGRDLRKISSLKSLGWAGVVGIFRLPMGFGGWIIRKKAA